MSRFSCVVYNILTISFRPLHLLSVYFLPCTSEQKRRLKAEKKAKEKQEKEAVKVKFASSTKSARGLCLFRFNH